MTTGATGETTNKLRRTERRQEEEREMHAWENCLETWISGGGGGGSAVIDKDVQFVVK